MNSNRASHILLHDILLLMMLNIKFNFFQDVEPFKYFRSSPICFFALFLLFAFAFSLF